ncbi:hypothetical protein QA995_22805 [Streptomyces scabiei]|uniref:hypothetical protein n=1 Tax=Streptomyces scabiei TaxID=1930 RepID=UPI000765E297|nr:hypothetical protein [Streptomyces scabiei]
MPGPHLPQYEPHAAGPGWRWIRQTSLVSTVAPSDDAEARFLEMADLLSRSCAPDVSSGIDDLASASVADIGNGVTVEEFGALEGVSVTEVRL